MTDPVRFREAVAGDLPAIVALLVDDDLGAAREPGAGGAGGDLAGYRTAFDAIDADPRHTLLVGDEAGEVVAVLQLTVLPCLTHGGRTRAQVEGVRVAGRLRGRGVGRALFEEAFARARAAGCGVVQLTTDTSRPDALRFYESLGFVASHHGLKLDLAS